MRGTSSFDGFHVGAWPLASAIGGAGDVPPIARHDACSARARMDTSRFEDRLRSERAELAETLAHITALLSQGQLEESGELSMVDQHIADVATDTELRELDLMRRKFVEDRIALIDDALERIRRGTYGKCVVCRDPILLER